VTATVPTTEPESLVAGDTWHWTKSVADYPPGDGWTLKYSIRGPSVLLDTNVTVTEDGSVYDVVVDADKTSALEPGTYRWQARVEKDGARYTVDSGVILVERDLSQAAEGDAQPYSEKMLAAIDAVLTGRITADVEQYQIAGRAVTKIPIAELRKLRAACKAELAKVRNGGKTGSVIKMRFTRAS
jgi:hypothetical protein